MLLLVGLAESVVHDPVVVHDEPMAEHGRESELAHQRAGELFERVRQQNDLRLVTQLVEEGASAIERHEPGDDVLDQRHREPVLGEQVEAIPHEHVVVRFVTCGAPQPVDPGALRDRDPDLGDEHAFDIERHDRLAGVVHRASLAAPCPPDETVTRCRVERDRRISR